MVEFLKESIHNASNSVFKTFISAAESNTPKIIGSNETNIYLDNAKNAIIDNIKKEGVHKLYEKISKDLFHETTKLRISGSELTKLSSYDDIINSTIDIKNDERFYQTLKKTLNARERHEDLNNLSGPLVDNTYTLIAVQSFIDNNVNINYKSYLPRTPDPLVLIMAFQAIVHAVKRIYK